MVYFFRPVEIIFKLTGAANKAKIREEIQTIRQREKLSVCCPIDYFSKFDCLVCAMHHVYIIELILRSNKHAWCFPKTETNTHALHVSFCNELFGICIRTVFFCIDMYCTVYC